jgi:hypothetical protein
MSEEVSEVLEIVGQVKAYRANVFIVVDLDEKIEGGTIFDFDHLRIARKTFAESVIAYQPYSRYRILHLLD